VKILSCEALNSTDAAFATNYREFFLRHHGHRVRVVAAGTISAFCEECEATIQYIGLASFAICVTGILTIE
jgi:hypothetical protein